MMRFRDRLTIFLIALLAGVNLLTIALTYSFARHAMAQAGQRELAIANQSFKRNLDIIAERVTTGVEVLALDYGLRAAIAADDAPTTLSTLRNHGRRINARRMMFIDLDAEIRVDTARPSTSPQPFQFDTMIASARRDGAATALVSLDGAMNWTVITPILAPQEIGFVAAFVPVDAALLDDLRALSSTPASLALVSPAKSGAWTVLASSRESERNDISIPEEFDPAAGLIRNRDGVMILPSQLPTAEGSAPVYAVHFYRLSDVFASNWSLFGPLFLLLAGGVVIAAIGSIVIARGVAAPLEVLAQRAQRIRQGDYDIPIETEHAAREVQQLSAALAETAEAVRNREADLKETNRSLEIARDEAESADRAKSKFIANMSHELRTPLNSIIGFADVIRQQQLGPLGADAYGDYANFIAKSGRGLLDLHNSILDIARLDADKFDLQTDDVDLREVVEKLQDEFADAASEKKISFKSETGGVKAPVEADYTAILKAARNLLHNAIKFTPENGRVSLRLSVSDEFADLIVTDSGIGMAQDEVARMMQPFQRGHVDYNAEYPGAGLGLSIADGIARLHGGRLAIISAPMKGLKAVVRLPLKSPSLGKAVA